MKRLISTALLCITLAVGAAATVGAATAGAGICGTVTKNFWGTGHGSFNADIYMLGDCGGADYQVKSSLQREVNGVWAQSSTCGEPCTWVAPDGASVFNHGSTSQCPAHLNWYCGFNRGTAEQEATVASFFNPTVVICDSNWRMKWTILFSDNSAQLTYLSATWPKC